ncbi:MAG: adenylosuccinate synthetase, partial [Firmicutes bacterium]|nr:adenylosuccinate synthetase [Bacillota bacterium]
YSHLADILEWKNLTLTGVSGAEPYTMQMLKEWVDTWCEPIRPYICDTVGYLNDAGKQGKSILFEAQLGALRDLDFGICPYTTSSNTLAGYAPVGSGALGAPIHKVIGVVKAYSTCVGEGPFVCEMFGREAESLREAGAEYGAKTGRPRRVGPLDLVATKYGAMLQNVDRLAVTKLDVLSYLDKIPVCTHYVVKGRKTDKFPFPTLLAQATPVISEVDGWKCDISGIRRWEALPEQAKRYIEMIEAAVGYPVGYISVGPERESIIIKD